MLSAPPFWLSLCLWLSLSIPISSLSTISLLRRLSIWFSFYRRLFCQPSICLRFRLTRRVGPDYLSSGGCLARQNRNVAVLGRGRRGVELGLRGGARVSPLAIAPPASVRRARGRIRGRSRWGRLALPPARTPRAGARRGAAALRGAG